MADVGTMYLLLLSFLIYSEGRKSIAHNGTSLLFCVFYVLAQLTHNPTAYARLPARPPPVTRIYHSDRYSLCAYYEYMGNCGWLSLDRMMCVCVCVGSDVK